MATLSDFSHVMGKIGPFRFVYRLYREITEDQVFTLASALAYSWLFAIFPFMIFMLTLIPHLPASARQRALDELGTVCRKALPKEAADTILDNARPLLQQPQPVLLVLGIALTVFSASGGMNATMCALDRCYEVKVGRPFYVQRPIAMLLTIAVATMVILVSILLPIGAVVIEWMTNHGWMHPVVAYTLGIARYACAIALMFLILAILYHFGPGVKQHFVLFSPGSIFTISVWLTLEYTFRLYIDRCASYDKTYGAVGGVAIAMLMFYVIAVVLMIGCEINSEIDFEILGVPRGTKDLRRPKGAKGVATAKTGAGNAAAVAAASPGKVAASNPPAKPAAVNPPDPIAHAKPAVNQSEPTDPMEPTFGEKLLGVGTSLDAGGAA
jgi:membrane protein